MPPLLRFLSRRMLALRHAVRGVFVVFRSQPSAWFHMLTALAVVIAGVCLEVTRADWPWLVLCIALIWLAEALNTAIEFLADAVTLERHPLIRNAKDIGAGAVLLAAIGAGIIGVLVLGPYVGL